VRLIFGKDLVTEPVIYHLGKNYAVVTNIRRADVTREESWVVLEMTGEPEELDRGVTYLESRGVRVEPVEGDVIE